MQVNILDHTGEPELTIAAAARLCYSEKTPFELKKGLTVPERERLIRMIRDLGHLSTFEHLSLTFGIDGISRVCSHQLVRHRLASYSQQSQRYVDLSGKIDYIIPKSIFMSRQRDHSRKMFKMAHDFYKLLIEEGVPPEDARYFLPQAVTTNIVVTMNARELLHFFELRCCRRAQWEIRKLACLMLKEAQKVAPIVFEKAGPSCMNKGKCQEGKMTCGKPVKSVNEILEEI